MGKSRKVVKRFRKNHENKVKMKKLIEKNQEVIKDIKESLKK